jgi:hypothetical protein
MPGPAACTMPARLVRQPRPRLATAVALLLLSLAGCSHKAERAAGGDAPSVPRPGVAVRTSPFALALCQGDRPEACDFRCSGTLIAPNLVLTARHCAYLAKDAKVDCAADRFSDEPLASPNQFWATSDPEMKLDSNSWRRGAMFRVPRTPAGTPIQAVCGADLLLLVLDRPISSADVVPATPALSGSAAATEFEATVTTMGYGETSPDAGDFGVRRARTDSAVLCVPGEPRTARACASFANELVDREFVVDATGCEGDSGSGAYAPDGLDHGEPKILGVLSRGELAFPTCSRAIYERVDRWGEFLVEGARSAAAFGHYAPPAWTVTAHETSAGSSAAHFPERSVGAPCRASNECESNQCGTNNAGLDWACTVSCDSDAACPANFRCLGARGERLCFYVPTPTSVTPFVDEPPSGCGTSPNPSLAGTWLFALAAATWTARRRLTRTHQSKCSAYHCACAQTSRE